VRFEHVLAYGRPSAFGWIAWILLSSMLGAYGAWATGSLLGLVVPEPTQELHAAASVLGFAALFTVAIRCAHAQLVFRRERITIPRLLRRQVLAYEDVASYSLAEASISQGRAGILEGHRLTIRSRRPDGESLELFIPATRPLDAALLARLDLVIGAQGDSPAHA
jgi:hypothetical protein